jgi:hypothetical protein
MLDLAGFCIDSSMKMNRALAKNIVNTYSRGTIGPHGGVKALAEAVQINNPRKLETTNEKIVKEMLARTRNSVSQISSRAKHYGAERGRLTGGLQRAVRSDKFAYSDAHGIYFANTQVLNDEAKHWARLNFGAGKAAGKGGPNGVFRLRFDDRVIGPPVGFRDKPRPGFSMPAGIFFDGDGNASIPRHEFSGASTGNEFRPGAVTLVKTVTRGGPGAKATVRIKKRLPTVGIKARHYLDAGLQGLEDRFPIEYKIYFDERMAEASEKAEKGVRIKPGTLFPL